MEKFICLPSTTNMSESSDKELELIRSSKMINIGSPLAMFISLSFKLSPSSTR